MLIKRFSRIVIACILITSLLTGCGNKEEVKVVDSTTGSSTSTAPAKRTEVVKLDIFESGNGATLESEEKDFIRQEIKKAINVDVNLQLIDAFEDYKNQVNIKIAAGQIPDLFLVPDRAIYVQFANDGALFDVSTIEKRLDKYAKLVGEEQVKKTYVNGKSYAISKTAPANQLMTYIRQDWLDTLKLDMPTTPEELLEVAKAFTEKDPDGNGKNDTYGLGGYRTNAFAPIYGAYGLPHKLLEPYVKEDKITVGAVEPQFADAIAVSKKFVDAGVVEPETMATSEAQSTDKMFKGKVGIIFSAWTIKKDENMAKITAVNPNANWVGLGALKGPGGQIGVAFDPMGSSIWAMPKRLEQEPEKVDAIVDLLNYLSSDGMKLVMYGQKDIHYKEEGEKITMIPNPPTTNANTWLYQITGRNEMDYLSTKFSKQFPDIQKAVSQPMITTYGSLVNKPQDYIQSEAEKYLEEEVTKFLYGKRPLSEFAKFTDTLQNTFKVKTYIDGAQKQLKDMGYVK